MRQLHPIRTGLTFALAAAAFYVFAGRESAIFVLATAVVAGFSGTIAWVALFHRATVASRRAAIAGLLAAFITVMSGLSVLMLSNRTPLRRVIHEFMRQLSSLTLGHAATILSVFVAAGLVLAHWSRTPPAISAFSLPVPLVDSVLLGLTAALTVAFRCQFDPQRPHACARLAVLAGFFAAALTFVLSLLLNWHPSFSIAASIALGSFVVALSLPMALAYAAAIYWNPHAPGSLAGVFSAAFRSGLRVNSWLGFALGGLAGAFIAASEEKDGRA